MSEEKRLKQLIKSKEDDAKTLLNREKEMQKMDNMFKDLKDAEANDSAALKAAKKKFEALNAGMEIDDKGEAKTLQEQLISKF